MPINKEYLKNQQYQNADNLTARRDLFYYGTNPEPLWQWLVKQYVIQPKSRILEVGCGTGDFWHEASKTFPKDCDIVLTDFSAGMLANVEKNLASVLDCRYEVADVENLSYGEHSFDVVLAHLMLYHTNSPEHALIEIKRVLKPTGFSGILLSGADNMQPLFTLLNCENPRHAQRFTAEIASEVLPKHFASVKQFIYHNMLKIPAVGPIIAYLRSLSTMETKDAAFYAHCEQVLSNHLQQNRFLLLPTSRHLFIVS